MDTNNDPIGQMTDRFMFRVRERLTGKGFGYLQTCDHNAVFEEVYDLFKRLMCKDDPDYLAWEKRHDRVAALHAELEDAVRDNRNEWGKHAMSNSQRRIRDILARLDAERGSDE